MAYWMTLMALAELPPDRPVTVRVRERDLVLARCAHGGVPHVLENRCPHRGGQLGDGRLEGDDIICPLHGYDYDLETGISRYSTDERVAAFPVRVYRDEIQIDADAVMALPQGHDDGYLDRWARRHDTRESTYEYLSGLASGPPVSAMRTNRELRPSWDDVLLVPGQLARPPRLASERLALRTVLGKRAAQPLEMEVPFFISHMSFGALSVSAKTALARVAGELGTAMGSGEGGLLDEEREHAGRVIFEMASGYFGWSTENIERADAIEIKIGLPARSPGPASLAAAVSSAQT